MRKVILFLFLGLFITGCATLPTSKEMATADYGQYPDNYNEIVQNWINDTFFDPYSVRDLTISTPQKYYISEAPLMGGRRYFGYYVSVTCNAKNRMGGYVGKQTSNLFIRNGIIIKQWKEGEFPY